MREDIFVSEERRVDEQRVAHREKANQHNPISWHYPGQQCPDAYIDLYLSTGKLMERRKLLRSDVTPLSCRAQISYNFMLPFDEIPDDLVPLTAYFKYLLTLATKEQPILLFLDSVDQLTGVQGNKLSWLPTRLPSNCKVLD